ncbi:probable polygalacturonase At3g15720 [Cicer arietinum]
MCVIASPSLYARKTPQANSTFNVITYGAIGDGNTDDTNAFVKAWNDVCSTNLGTPTLIIPENKTFVLQQVLFQGPCKSATVTIKLQGTINAPNFSKASKWKVDGGGKWLKFSHINGLVVNGGGQINGQGEGWWKKFPKNRESKRPTALQFIGCQNLTVSNLTHINSAKNHISITSCQGVSISNLHIVAPGNSPNTDGIDISSSTNVAVTNSNIETGDDCIAINNGCSFINISGIFCGPGHGISVGSLGKGGSRNTVEEVYVKNCTFNGTTNGARIKTWPRGRGYAKNIRYENIKLIGVKNPVIIDQTYHPLDNYDNGSETLKVSNVTYKNIWGTSISKDAIQLNCGPEDGCTNIVLNHINITGVGKGKTFATCTNAHGSCSSSSPNVPCLSGKI